MSVWGPFTSLFMMREEYDTALVELELRHGQKVFRGQGRLVCRLDGTIELWALTDGGEEILALDDLPEIGALITADQHMQLTARDRSGHAISIDRLMQCADVVYGQPVVRCWQRDDLLSNIQWTRNQTATGPAEPRSANVVLEQSNGELVDSWLSPNARLNASTAIFDVKLAGTSDGRVLLSIDGSVDVNIRRAIDSVYHAIGFVFGRRLNEIVSSVTENGQDVEQVAIRRGAVCSSPYSPFGPSNHHRMVNASVVSELFGKAISFFHRPEGETSRNQLYAIWNSADRSYSVSVLVASAVLEGLCNDLRMGLSVQTSIRKDQIDAIAKFIVSEDFRNVGQPHLDVDALTKLQKRIVGALDRFNDPSTSNLLKQWCKDGKYGMQPATFSGWNHVRNRVAHGQFDLFDDVNNRGKLVKIRNAIYQGINAIMLHRMGYSGPSFDWITGCWRESQLTPTVT